MQRMLAGVRRPGEVVRTGVKKAVQKALKPAVKQAVKQAVKKLSPFGRCVLLPVTEVLRKAAEKRR
jgi:hypothetical protein